MPYLNDRFAVGPQILWDTWVVAPNTATGTQVQLFTDPISGAKSKLLTNMNLVSTLPEPQVYMALGLQIRPSTQMLRADLENLYENFWWEFWVGERYYGEGHFEDAPGGPQLTGFDVANGASVINSGTPNFSSYFSFAMPAMNLGSGIQIPGYEGININRSERFYLKLLSPTGFTTATEANGGSGINLRVNIMGYIARQVQ